MSPFLVLTRLTASARPVLAWIGWIAWAGLALALWAQHRWGMEPCAWCVLQRVLVLAVACLATLGAVWVRSRTERGAFWLGGVLSVLAALGLGAAWFQHTVAAQRWSCALTWADRVLAALGLPEQWPAIFEPRASCAEAGQAKFLSLPFELWGALGFFLILLLSLRLVWIARPRHAGGAS